jgi:hypothetical protein
MTQYIVKGRYTDSTGRSHNFVEETDLADRGYIEDFIRSRYPVGKWLFINNVRQK